MTPELRAAVDHLRAFLDDIDECFRATGTDPAAHRDAPVILAPGYDLTIGDLHALLTALDPAEQPIDRIPTAAGLDYLAIRQQQHPRTVRDFRGLAGGPS